VQAGRALDASGSRPRRVHRRSPRRPCILHDAPRACASLCCVHRRGAALTLDALGTAPEEPRGRLCACHPRAQSAGLATPRGGCAGGCGGAARAVLERPQQREERGVVVAPAPAAAQRAHAGRVALPLDAAAPLPRASTTVAVGAPRQSPRSRPAGCRRGSRGFRGAEEGVHEPSQRAERVVVMPWALAGALHLARPSLGSAAQRAQRPAAGQRGAGCACRLLGRTHRCRAAPEASGLLEPRFGLNRA